MGKSTDVFVWDEKRDIGRKRQFFDHSILFLQKAFCENEVSR